MSSVPLTQEAWPVGTIVDITGGWFKSHRATIVGDVGEIFARAAIHNGPVVSVMLEHLQIIGFPDWHVNRIAEWNGLRVGDTVRLPKQNFESASAVVFERLMDYMHVKVRVTEGPLAGVECLLHAASCTPISMEGE